MTAHDFLAQKAERLAEERGGFVVRSEDLQKGDRFFPAANNGAQVFTVAAPVKVDRSRLGFARDWIMVQTVEAAEPHRCGRFDLMIKLG